MDAEFKKIPGTETYFASKDGRILSTTGRTNRILKQGLTHNKQKKGYLVVYIKDQGTRTVHSLVAETYLGEKPQGTEINHKDGIKTNNNVSNLEYISRSENAKHAIKMGLSNPISDFGLKSARGLFNKETLDDVRKLYSEGISKTKIAKKYDVHYTTIDRIINKETYKYD